jgi:hypothetical protein
MTHQPSSSGTADLIEKIIDENADVICFSDGVTEIANTADLARQIVAAISRPAQSSSGSVLANNLAALETKGGIIDIGLTPEARDLIVAALRTFATAQGQPNSALDALCVVETDLDRLRTAAKEACDLLAERKHGSPARSPGHNARRLLECTLSTLASAERSYPDPESRWEGWPDPPPALPSTDRGI